MAPGAYGGITARLIEQAGFAAMYMTSAGTAAARSRPDFGLLKLTEMVDAATLAHAVFVPLISGADPGYGNGLCVTRTVREVNVRS